MRSWDDVWAARAGGLRAVDAGLARERTDALFERYLAVLGEVDARTGGARPRA